MLPWKCSSRKAVFRSSHSGRPGPGHFYVVDFLGFSTQSVSFEPTAEGSLCREGPVTSLPLVSCNETFPRRGRLVRLPERQNPCITGGLRIMTVGSPCCGRTVRRPSYLRQESLRRVVL